LSTREAARALGVTERSVRYAIARGELPATKRGGAYRIASEGLARYVAGRRGGFSRPLARVLTFPAAWAGGESLPTSVSAFVGRDAELAALAGLLTDPAVRLVTLTGPGGIGKTRLAIAAAAFVRVRFADGVVFVALAAVSQARLVVPAIADALGVRDLAGRDRHAQLRAFLRDKHLLLVLDNVEQVLAVAPELATLVAEAPALTLLVTSRASLRVSGEREVPVPPLTLAGHGATPAELLASDAGQVFVAQAKANDPSFGIDEETAPIVAEICARLDGLPLAIELAVARLKTLPPRQLRERLERRLPLLTAAARDAPDRHRTMRDAITWSYDLLTPAEQRFFQRLAVFVDGCTLEAASRVAGLQGYRVTGGSFSLSPSSDTIDLIGSLVDQSLLVRETGFDGEPRFRMLDTIREFGLDQLVPDAEETARAAHARHFLDLVLGLRRLTMTRATSVPIVRLAADEANLRAAHDWLAERGPAADFASIVAASYIFWYMLGRLRDAVAWIEQALTHHGAIATADAAWLFIGLAELRVTQGDVAQAAAAFAEGLRRIRAAGDAVDLVLALIAYGAWLNIAERYAEGETCLEEALAMAETIADPSLRATLTGRALANLGISARGRGDLALATARGEEALRCFHGLDLDLAETRALADLADIAIDQGQHRQAAERYLACIERTGERGEVRVIPDALAGIASTATALGHHRSALLLFGAADAWHERVETAMFFPPHVARVSRDLAMLRKILGEREADTILAEGRILPFAEIMAAATAVAGPDPAAAAQAARPLALTRREREVFRLLAVGQTDREIAAALYMSPRTVEWHVRNILAKFDLSSRREAVALARANDLV
jgi:non-specific serine/threonine protein kinase